MKRLLKHNSPYLFLFRFLVCFFILYLFFPFYRGLVGAGGKFHSTSLEAHFNLITAFTKFLVGSAKWVLEVSGYEVHQRNYRSLNIAYSRGINVNPSCLGWAVMSFWFAFVFANVGAARHKLKWITSGIVLIVLLNITRITFIAIANHLDWKPITSLDHHQTFNVASYSCIVMLMLWYISCQRKHERGESTGEQAHRRLSTI